MKISVRRGVFETNSSSTHSLSFCKASEYSDWANGKLFYSEGGDKFLTEQEVRDVIKEHIRNWKSYWKPFSELYPNLVGNFDVTDKDVVKTLGEVFDIFTFDFYENYYYNLIYRYEKIYEEVGHSTDLVAFGYHGIDD